MLRDRLQVFQEARTKSRGQYAVDNICLVLMSAPRPIVGACISPTSQRGEKDDAEGFLPD
jgi:hypothetical protein